MTNEHLVVFAVAHCMIATAISLYTILRRRSVSAVGTFLAAALSLWLVTIVGARLNPNVNYTAWLIGTLASLDRGNLASAVLGVATATPWLQLPGAVAQNADSRRGWYIRLGRAVPAVALSVAVVLVGLVTVAFASWSEYQSPRYARLLLYGAVEQRGMKVRRVAKLEPPEAHPIAIAVDENETVYATFYSYRVGVELGGIYRFVEDESTGTFSQEVVVQSTLLARSFGLAVRDGDLFVNRSGRLSHASNGSVRHEMAGAVTRIRDLNDDGIYEYVDDLVSGIPGARGPVTQHQNYGLQFLSDGSLLIASGNASDHAQPMHPWAGTILRLSSDFETVEVFAEGLRNPFGLTVTDGGQIIGTDNDSDSRAGDEINWIRKNGHYGHPYDHDLSFESEGFDKPIFRGGLRSNLTGLVFVPQDHPVEALRNSLLVCDPTQNRIWRIRLDPAALEVGEPVVQDATPFFDVPNPIDIVMGPSGSFYIVTFGRESTNALFRIRPVDR